MLAGSSGDKFGDLVFVLPGILGSRLVRREGKRTKTVWDFSIKRLPSLIRSLATRGLVLEGDPAKPPDDGIEADALFNYQLLPGFFGVDDYSPLVDALSAAVGRRQVREFSYDWRASNRHAAARLANAVEGELRDWKLASGNDGAKVWLVGHSMGGLVARYYCEHLGGASQTRALVTIGTPHRGSVRALDALVNGVHLGPFDLTRLVRSLASVHELLPLFPVIGPAGSRQRIAELYALDPVTGADLAGGAAPPAPFAGLDRERLRSALEFHAGVRQPAERRAASGEQCPYAMHVFFNRRQPTATSATIDGAGVKLVEEPLGDGTVPAVAAVPIEWDDTGDAIPIGEKHAAMQATDGVRDALANWVLPLPVAAAKGVRDDEVVELGIDPVLDATDELVVRVATQHAMNLHVEVAAEDERQPRDPARRPVQTRPGRTHEVGFGRRAPGVHSVVVRRGPTVAVSDHVYVAGAED